MSSNSSEAIVPGRARRSASIYMFTAALIGLIVGGLVGEILDAAIPGRRTLAVLAALVAIAVEYAARRYLGNALPTVLSHQEATTSPSLFVTAVVIALAGGLAIHDLGLVWNMMWGLVLGGGAGLFAALMASVLVVLREGENRPVAVHPERNVP
jgi:hypothetical protein